MIRAPDLAPASLPISVPEGTRTSPVAPAVDGAHGKRGAATHRRRPDLDSSS